MTRTAIAIVLALAALALLVSLSLDSRPVPIDAHVAQHTYSSGVDGAAGDFAALLGVMDAAWAAQRAPGDGARTLLTRVEQRPREVPPALLALATSAERRAWLANTNAGFTDALVRGTQDARALLAAQTRFGDAVTLLRESSAAVIQALRDAGLDRAAVEMLRLAVAAEGFAASGTPVEEEVLALLATLSRDQRVEPRAPESAEALLAAITTIFDERRAIESGLAELRSLPVAQHAGAAARAANDVYTAAVTRVDQARLMLAVYSVILLAAVSFVAFRLHSSYRDLNRSNAELAELNQSLEERVTRRTQELAGTVASLKESQVQLVQAEKMSSLGQLVAGISHEINTPLLYLANNAELIRERLSLLERFVGEATRLFGVRAEDYPDRAQYQRAFLAALKDLKRMLRDEEIEANLQEAQDLARDSIDGLTDLTEIAQSLKDFSRLDRAPIARFDVNAGLDKTLLIARNVTKHKANVMRFYGEVPEIECSPSQINQVFLNLITNAAQAIETHGEIAVTTKLHDPAHVAVRISDTGCGIPPELIGKIRDPFFTTKEVGTGTGLGLSIVDEIVRAHGGRLEIESQVGKGSAFTVILPIKRKGYSPSDDSADGLDAPEAGDEPELFAEAV